MRILLIENDRVPGGPSEGRGPGLAIVREITGRHGGAIDLLAGDGGRGLRVRVDLPLAAGVEAGPGATTEPLLAAH